MKRTTIKSYIGRAITKRRVLEFSLKDTPNDIRQGHPHLLGYRDMKDDSEVEAVRIFLSEDGKDVDNFRCINIDSFETAETTTDTFEPHPKYNKNDKDFNLKKPYKRI